MPEHKGFYITEDTLAPSLKWCIYKNRQSWVDGEPEIHRTHSLQSAEGWIDRKVYEVIKAKGPAEVQLAAIRAKQGDPLCEELPITEEDHKACRKYGSNSAVRKFRDRDTGTISTFCEL